MDLILTILQLLGLIATLPIHELGHYLPAWRFGWKPRFGFDYFNGIKWIPCFAVKTSIDIHIEDEKDFLIVHKQLTMFSLGGTVAGLAFIALLAQTNLYPASFASFMFMANTLYGFIEAMFVKFDVKATEAT